MRLIIYDLDGTLADTRQDIALAVNHMLVTLGTPPLPEGTIGGFVGGGLHHLVRKCLRTEDAQRIEEGARIYRDYYAAHMLDHTRLYPGARKILDYFRNKRQAVITNKPNPFSREILTALGVADFFSEIVAGDSGYPKKPDPAALLAIMEREKIGSRETLFVGDSAIDIEAGRRAGVTVAALTHGFGKKDELQSQASDVLAEDFEALLKIAKERKW